jgi:hypothetical protein
LIAQRKYIELLNGIEQAGSLTAPGDVGAPTAAVVTPVAANQGGTDWSEMTTWMTRCTQNPTSKF